MQDAFKIISSVWFTCSTAGLTTHALHTHKYFMSRSEHNIYISRMCKALTRSLVPLSIFNRPDISAHPWHVISTFSVHQNSNEVPVNGSPLQGLVFVPFVSLISDSGSFKEYHPTKRGRVSVLVREVASGRPWPADQSHPTSRQYPRFISRLRPSHFTVPVRYRRAAKKSQTKRNEKELGE